MQIIDPNYRQIVPDRWMNTAGEVEGLYIFEFAPRLSRSHDINTFFRHVKNRIGISPGMKQMFACLTWYGSIVKHRFKFTAISEYICAKASVFTLNNKGL